MATLTAETAKTIQRMGLGVPGLSHHADFTELSSISFCAHLQGDLPDFRHSMGIRFAFPFAGGTVMQTLEIQPARWSRALEEFSVIHEGWLVSVDVIAQSLGAQPEVSNLPLMGVVAEIGSRREPVVTVAAGLLDGQQITHTIQAPTRIWIERTDEGADAAMEIESADGTKTILRLKTPVRAETVDGIARG